MFSERMIDALVFVMKERQREMDREPSLKYLYRFLFSFSFFLRQDSFNYAVNLVGIASSPKTKKIERSTSLLFSFSI